MKLSKIFSNYYTVRNEMVDLTKDLTDEQLDWSPEGHTASIRKLLVHIAEAEYWWLSCVAAGNFENWDESKFPDNASKEKTFELLKENFDNFSDYLESSTTDQWDEIFYERPRGDKVSLRWLVWHVVEHQARHRGQILTFLRMAGVEFKDV